MTKSIDAISEKKLKTIMKTICIVFILISPPMIILNYFKGAQTLATIEIGTLLGFSVILFYLFKVKPHKKGYKLLNRLKIIMLSTIVLFHLLVLFLPTHHTVFTHSAVVIMIIFLMLGQRRGLPLAILVAVVSVSIFIYKYSTKVADLPATGLGNILILIFITFVVSYFNESTRLKYESALLEKNENLDLLSKTDGLTQLFNRRYFDQVLQEEWSRLQRSKLHLSVILCDIDHFKQFNDINGHVAGDLCIKKVASSLKNSVRRSSDIVARYGGEEFIFLLPQMDTEGAQHLAQKIMADIEDLNISHPAYQDKRVSLSLGVSTLLPNQKSNPYHIVSLADKALYKSKNNGRNQITVLNDPSFS